MVLPILGGSGTITGGLRTIYRLAKDVPIIKDTIEYKSGGPNRTLGFEPSASGPNPKSNDSKANQIGSHTTFSDI